MAMAESPVTVRARLDEPLSRWLWLVKWLLAIPHLVVLVFLLLAVLGLTVFAFFAILFTGRYPAGLEVDYSEQLSRGLVLVKWWLLAIPHYLVLSVFAGGGGYAASKGGDWEWSGPSLTSLLVFFAAVMLLFANRYPRGIFDFVMGLNRWVLRVVPYAALMRDEYPPFRLDLGGD